MILVKTNLLHISELSLTICNHFTLFIIQGRACQDNFTQYYIQLNKHNFFNHFIIEIYER